MANDQSWLNVANMALSQLNQENLQSLDESSVTAAQVNVMLRPAVRMVLQENDWKSARKRIALAPMLSEPAFGYDNQFKLPDDFIRIVKISGVDSEGIELSGEDLTWTREGDRILADADLIRLIYIAYPENASTLDPYITDAIAFFLASRLAAKLLSDTSMTSTMHTLAQNAITSARLHEAAGEEDIAMESSPEEFLNGRDI